MLQRVGVRLDPVIADRLDESDELGLCACLVLLVRSSFFNHLIRTPLAQPRLGPGNLSINGEFNSGPTNQNLFSKRHSSGKA